MFKFFDNKRSATLAHYKSISQQIERSACQSGIARPSAHGFDDVERADGNGRERRFGAAGDNHIRKVVPDITQRFADRYSSTGATVRICGADAAKSELDRDIRVGRTAEYLN